MLHRPPAADAKRQRLAKLAADKRALRSLQKAGGGVLRSLPVRDLNGLIAALIDLKWLREAESEDRKALIAAVGALLDDIVSRHR